MAATRKAKIDRSVYREQPTTPLPDWTPHSCKSALLEAQTGTLRAAADLWEALCLDNRIQQGVNKRARKLLGLPLQFEAGKGRRKNLAKRAAEAEQDFFYSFPESNLTELQSWGLGLGVGLGEQIWERPEDHGGRDVPRLKVWNPRWLRYDLYRERWMLQVRDQGEIEITPGDGKWILYTPYGQNRPWMRGLWWPCVPWFLLKQLALIDWSQHNRQHGSPMRVGKAPKGSTEAARQDFARQLAKLVNGGSFCMPDGWDAMLLELLRDNSKTFSGAIELADRSLDITILGSNLTTSVTGGSLAAAEVQERGEEDQTAFDGDTLGSCLHDQSLTFWCGINFGTEAAAPWPAWETTPPENLAKTATTLKTLGEGLVALGPVLAAQGHEVDMQAMAEKYAIPIRALTSPPPETPEEEASETKADANPKEPPAAPADG